jgi:hypothetical protein
MMGLWDGLTQRKSAGDFARAGTMDDKMECAHGLISTHPTIVAHG